MSENGVTRLLLIILAFTWPQKGTSLECYVCTSVNDVACTSSLSDIELSTCTWDESSNSSTTTVTESETTTVSTESTTSSDPVTTITTITDSSTSSTTSTPAETTSTAENSTSDSTTLETTTSSGITSTNIIERTTDSPSGTTDAQTTTQAAITTQSVTSAAATTTEGTTTVGTESASTTVVSEAALSRSLDSKNSEPLVRSIRATDVDFACYTLTLIKDGETVTDRGCVVQSNSMCETLNEENYPGQNLSTCTTCTEDGCNSSPINTSGIPSVLFPFIMFILTR